MDSITQAISVSPPVRFSGRSFQLPSCSALSQSASNSPLSVQFRVNDLS